MRSFLIGASLAVFATACSSKSDDALPGDGGADVAEVAVTKDASGDTSPLALGKITATVNFAGTQKGPLSVGVFSENPPKTRPPVSFDTATTPSFPYTATLRDIEPGHYWVVAVIDLPPLSPGALRPGPEDLLGASMPIDIVGNDTLTTEVVIPDASGADAGHD